MVHLYCLLRLSYLIDKHCSRMKFVCLVMLATVCFTVTCSATTTIATVTDTVKNSDTTDDVTTGRTPMTTVTDAGKSSHTTDDVTTGRTPMAAVTDVNTRTTPTEEHPVSTISTKPSIQPTTVSTIINSTHSENVTLDDRTPTFKTENIIKQSTPPPLTTTTTSSTTTTTLSPTATTHAGTTKVFQTSSGNVTNEAPSGDEIISDLLNYLSNSTLLNQVENILLGFLSNLGNTGANSDPSDTSPDVGTKRSTTAKPGTSNSGISMAGIMGMVTAIMGKEAGNDFIRQYLPTIMVLIQTQSQISSGDMQGLYSGFHASFTNAGVTEECGEDIIMLMDGLLNMQDWATTGKDQKKIL